MGLSRREFVKSASAALSTALLMPSLAHATPSARPLNAGAVWQQFKSKHVKSDGRVVDKANGGISHTEGQGVALLAAATVGDRAGFDSVLGFTRKMKRPDGLYSWKCNGKGQVSDVNNATDGDLYIAWALCRAYKQFGTAAYLQEAVAVASAIRKNCVVQSLHGTVLIPGKDGFIRQMAGRPTPVLNPAYWVFPAFNELNEIDPSPTWGACTKTALEVLTYAHFGKYELPADWLLMTDPVMPWPDRPARFGYDAIRVPLFLYWGGHQKHPSLKAFAQYARAPGFRAWIDLTDKAPAEYAAPAGFEAVAQLARSTLYLTPPQLPAIDDDYFSASLTMLSTLALSRTT